MERACRSGPLCVVVRTQDWKPQDGQVLKGVWLKEESGRKDRWKEVVEYPSQAQHDNEATSQSSSVDGGAVKLAPLDHATRAFFGLRRGDASVPGPRTSNTELAASQTLPQEDNSDCPLDTRNTTTQSPDSVNVEKNAKLLPMCREWNIGRGMRRPFLPATHGWHLRRRVIHGTCHLHQATLCQYFATELKSPTTPWTIPRQYDFVNQNMFISNQAFLNVDAVGYSPSVHPQDTRQSRIIPSYINLMISLCIVACLRLTPQFLK